MQGRVLAALSCLCPFVALGALSCTELNARWNDHQIFYGAVREPGTGATLTTFCAETSVERADAIVFSAPVGAIVEEEVFLEGRTEKYKGSAPERDQTFWCSDVAQLYVRPADLWVCLRTVDDDPPANIMAVEPRGEMGANGASSGYALTLQIRHPGVLRVILDAQCLRERSDAGPNDAVDASADVEADASADVDADTDPETDAGMPVPQRELTIQ
jgi:hypothetical protein